MKILIILAVFVAFVSAIDMGKDEPLIMKLYDKQVNVNKARFKRG